MEKADKENKSVESTDSGRGSSNKKLKINPNIKITPTAKSNGNETKKAEETNKFIEEKLKDFENEEKKKEEERTLEEQKLRIVDEVKQMAAMADDIYAGKMENTQDEEGKLKAMHDLFKNIVKASHDDFTELLKHNLEFEVNERLMHVLLGHENAERNTIHKLQILIRDLQEKTPKIQEEVSKFIEVQKEWRQEKELEFEKSIQTIRSQMAPSNPETGENEMLAKYNELCNYVDTMKNEGIDKIIKERDDKIKELEETKNIKLKESKNNIEEKIQTLKRENEKLKKELPQSRKDYTKHKTESKKLVQIISGNNQKKRKYKEEITKLNDELKDHKKNQKELSELVESLQIYNP